MKVISFIAQFPPPIHGLSKAVETLYSSALQSNYSFSKVDITNNSRILLSLWRIVMDRSDLFYFTIAQTRGGNWRDLFILKLLQWKKTKCLIHLHGGYYRTLIEQDCGKLQRMLNYRAIKHVAGAIVLGDSLKSIFRGIAAEDKIFVVPNCVDEQYLLNTNNFNLKKENLLVQPVLNILYLSNFIETKGYKKVLQLASMARMASMNMLHFHFAGGFFSEKERSYFNDFLTKYQLIDIVTYHGVVSGEEKGSLLKMCNIFILLTCYPNEGQPISILEAMGNAMVIVTTNHAGIPDVVKNGRNGLVVDKNNIELTKVYDYILQINDNRSMLQEICEMNYYTAKDYYTEKQYINNMNNVFQKVLKL